MPDLAHLARELHAWCEREQRERSRAAPPGGGVGGGVTPGKALRTPASVLRGRTPGKPRSVLASIWASVLGVEQLGVHDSFFELGGHSLLVIQVVVRIREAFEIELPFRSLFAAPTVAGLAETMLGLVGQRARIEQTAELLLQLSRLSDSEVDAMLAHGDSPAQAGAA